MLRDDIHTTKKILSSEIDTAKRRPGRAQSTWMGTVQRGTKTMGVEPELMQRRHKSFRSGARRLGGPTSKEMGHRKTKKT